MSDASTTQDRPDDDQDRLFSELGGTRDDQDLYFGLLVLLVILGAVFALARCSSVADAVGLGDVVDGIGGIDSTDITIDYGDDASGITLEGAVPDQETADALRAAAVAEVGEANVTDNLTVDRALTNNDGSIRVIGTVTTAAAATAATGAFQDVADELDVDIDVEGELVVDADSDSADSTSNDGDDSTGDDEGAIEEDGTSDGSAGTPVETTAAPAPTTTATSEQPQTTTTEPPAPTTTTPTGVADTLNALFSLDPVQFAYNSDDITSESRTILDKAVQVLTDNPDARLEVGGHTDSDGGAAANLNLSQARADSVRQFLIDADIDADRLEAKGYGESEPVADNDTEQNKAQNRRIEFKQL